MRSTTVRALYVACLDAATPAFGATVYAPSFDLLGFSDFRKPSKNDVMLRHGVGMPADEKPKIFLPVAGIPGHPTWLSTPTLQEHGASTTNSSTRPPAAP